MRVDRTSSVRLFSFATFAGDSEMFPLVCVCGTRVTMLWTQVCIRLRVLNNIMVCMISDMAVCLSCTAAAFLSGGLPKLCADVSSTSPLNRLEGQ